MPSVAALEALGNIACFVRESGYAEAQMKLLGLTKVPWRKSSATSLLPFKIPDNAALNLLARLFWFGEAAPFEEVASVFPRQITEDFLKCNLVDRVSETCVPQCMLVPFGELLLACDSVRKAHEGAPADLVLGTNTPTKILANSLMNRPDTDVLDLGTGCGTLAMIASQFAHTVTATDINPRALEFAQFNAALNGVVNFQTILGDRFSPVEGRKFDLIICNPPFFLKPASRMLFTDNPAVLDSFVEGLARAAPRFLKETGSFQMLCEWVAYQDEEWQCRLKRWFEGSGCDVLILKAYEMSPSDYVLTRAAESASLYREAPEDELLEHVEYFRQRQVVRIYGGLVTMRQRRAENWVVFDEMTETPDGPIGSLLLERFATQDILASFQNSELLALKPRLCKGVQLVEESMQQGQSWKSKRIYLERQSGLPRRLAFDRPVADFVGRFDGKRQLDVLINELANQNKAPRIHAEKNGLQLVRKLSSLGLIALDR